MLRELEATARRLIDMGVLELPSGRPPEASTEVVPAGGTDVPREASSPTEAKAPGPRRCEECSQSYTPHKQGASKSKFCSPKCRSRAGEKRRSARAAESDRATAAAIVEQTAAAGHSPLKWSNSSDA
jgi:hypothetical protein